MRTASGQTSVLLTGVAGFIGYHVAQRLLAEGAVVTGVDNMNAYYDIGLKQARLAAIGTHPNFTFVNLDLESQEPVKELFATVRPDVVIHLAAQAGVRYSLINPASYISANIDGFLAILEGARAWPVQHLIYASSSSVYGANTKVPFHEDDPVDQPTSLYAATKRSNELMAQTYAHLYAMPCSGLRFFTVYGPWGRPDMAYFKFTKAILAGAPIDVYNNGQMRRDFTYIDDVCEAVVRLMGHAPIGPQERAVAGADVGAPHRIYNVGNHAPVELAAFIETLETLLGRSAVKRLLPMQPGDVPATFADVERLTAVTGFAPKTPLVQGLSQFVDWYRGYYRA